MLVKMITNTYNFDSKDHTIGFLWNYEKSLQRNNMIRDVMGTPWNTNWIFHQKSLNNVVNNSICSSLNKYACI